MIANRVYCLRYYSPCDYELCLLYLYLILISSMIRGSAFPPTILVAIDSSFAFSIERYI